MLVIQLVCMATLSNCGESLIAQSTKHRSKERCGRSNDAGYGNNDWDWVIRSQVLQLYRIT